MRAALRDGDPCAASIVAVDDDELEVRGRLSDTNTVEGLDAAAAITVAHLEKVLPVFRRRPQGRRVAPGRHELAPDGALAREVARALVEEEEIP